MDYTLFSEVFFLISTLLIGLVYLYLTWNFNYWKNLGVKGPAPVLVYGSVHSIVTGNRNMVFDLQDLYEKYKNIGDKFIGIFMTRNPNILILDPKLAHDIMVSHFKAFCDNESSTWEEVSRRNPFLTLFGIDWRDRRTDFIGGLTPSKLKAAFPIVMEKCNKMTDFVRTTITKTGSNIEIQPREAVNLRDQNQNGRQDFLNHLIRLREKKNISNFDMVGHSLAVLLDSFDTAGLVVYHALIYLANNPISQTKLRQEIMGSLEEGQLTYEILSKLSYLDQCLNETIRLIAPITTISRMCTEKTFLEVSDGKPIQINPGMVVLIPVFAYHHDKEIFPNPEEFIPERFDNGKPKHFIENGSFVPFGAGPRICAGMKLGQLQCKA